MGVVLVGGVHGVGKTTTIESALSQVNKNIPLLKGSEIMARILDVSTEDLPHISPDLRKMARVLMYEELSRATNGVRDCHYSTYSDAGYEFPFATSTNIGTAAVAVLLEASPEKIVERRHQIERTRPTDIALVREHLELERQGATFAATRLEVPLRIISNELDTPDASTELAQIFKDYVI